jgi:cytochrome c biogenesis protein CcmG/thiol:disulfide interchange protein DsbE
MKISILKITIFSFVIFFLLVFWKGLKIDNNYNTKTLIGKKISNFKLIEINNDDQYISEVDFKNNRYTLINFFASWCAPCRIEHKYLLNLAKEQKKIKIIGINFKDKKNNAIKFLEELGNPYNFVGIDLEGRISILFMEFQNPYLLIII